MIHIQLSSFFIFFSDTIGQYPSSKHWFIQIYLWSTCDRNITMYSLQKCTTKFCFFAIFFMKRSEVGDTTIWVIRVKPFLSFLLTCVLVKDHQGSSLNEKIIQNLPHPISDTAPSQCPDWTFPSVGMKISIRTPMGIENLLFSAQKF